MSVAAFVRIGAGAAVLAVTFGAAACSQPAPQKCHRYDALSLTRDNAFAGKLEWKEKRMIDAAPERIEVAMTVIRPIRGPIELVHVVGDVEEDHWTLSVPDFNNVPTSLCWIAPPNGTPNCGASLQNVPFSPLGYYYLRPGDNTVLEAGLSFYLCD